MEKTLRKACNYGHCAKFWENVAKVCDKIGKIAREKGANYRQSQRVLLKSVNVDPEKLAVKTEA